MMRFSDTSTLVGHFLSFPRAIEKSDREIVEEVIERDRDGRGTGMKLKKQKK